MQDHILRATTPGGVRAFAAITTNLAEEARSRHQCYPVAAAALGRSMTAALMLAANLKNRESMTMRVAGNGPLGEIVSDADAEGNVRGYVKNPAVDLPLNGGKLNVGAAVGEGDLYITRFTGLRQPFTGSAKLVSGEIAEDVTQYLYVSEQTPSSVSLGVLIRPDMSVWAAGGFMVQTLPEAEEAVLIQIEKNLGQIAPVSQLVKEGKDAAGILELVFAGLPLTVFEKQPVQFKCTCSRERVGNILITLGKKEISGMIADGQGEVCCHFCGEKYQFTRKDLEAILERIDMLEEAASK
jgi:molecular chaperone Hsp33